MSKLKKFFLALFALTAVFCLVLGFAACEEEVKVQKLVIENARTEFLIGDGFELGEDFKVTALYSDGTEEDVTEKITYRQETGFDMNVAGDYQITISYGGKKEIYTIYVGDFSNRLRKIELDTANVKKTYKLGENISFEGLKISTVSENAQGNLVTEVTYSLKNFDVEIIGEDNKVSAEALMQLGKYTVTVSKSGIEASYEITVDGVDISGVQGAIAAGGVFRTEVVSGESVVMESVKGGPFGKSFHHEYTFGDNYTRVYDLAGSTADEYHYSIENGSIFCARVQNGKVVPAPNANTGAMFGSPYHLWYLSETEYGVENAISNLYSHAVKCSNKDLTEKADETKREYSFSFSGLEFRSNTYDYYETEVSFKLGADYFVESATFTQKYWEKKPSAPTFNTNAAGITYPTNPDVTTDTITATVTQVSGERTAKNPYTGDALKVKSYSLTLNGRVLDENPVIECSMQSTKLTICIEDIMPETASFEHDILYMDYEGNLNGATESTGFLDCEGFMVFRVSSNNTLSVTLRNGGVWKLILTTSGTRKVITFNVRGVAPSSMTGNIYNAISGKFVSASSKTVAIGAEAYFRGAVDKYADDRQTALITSSNAASATVTEAEIGGVKCFKFTATQEGVYTVTITSQATDKVFCTVTFTVSDAPDFAGILQGSYRTEDSLGNIYLFEFTPENDGDTVKGSLKVTLTPTNEDGAPLYDLSQVEDFTYTVDNMSILLTHVSGEPLGVDLLVNEENKLVLEDRYGTEYVLDAVID